MVQIPALLDRSRNEWWCVAVGSVRALVWAISGTSQAAILLDTSAVEKTVGFIVQANQRRTGFEDPLTYSVRRQISVLPAKFRLRAGDQSRGGESPRAHDPALGFALLDTRGQG